MSSAWSWCWWAWPWPWSCSPPSAAALPATLITFFTQAIGWGVYILPVGMIVMGFWLVLRRIEKLPRLTLERFTGFVLLFLWLLTVMQSIIPPDMRDQAAQDGIGGGYVGNTLAGFLTNAFGPLGVAVILVAWLLWTVTMIFDITVRDMFRWVPPLMAGIRAGATKDPANPFAQQYNNPRPVRTWPPMASPLWTAPSRWWRMRSRASR